MIDENTTDASSTAPHLSAIELRVLGVLMEKQLTTPDQYPLTLNSIVTACNQKSSREPITQYTQGEVTRTLNELDERHLVRRERGSRAEKFEQQLMNTLSLGRKQQALLCVMMLRGPQSLSELSTRTQRMCDFIDKEELELCVDRLCQREVPYTVRIAQQAGQRGERIMHLFSGAPDQSALPVATLDDQAESVSTRESRSVYANSDLSKSDRDNSDQTNPSLTNSSHTNSEQSRRDHTSSHGSNAGQSNNELLELTATVQRLQQETTLLRAQMKHLYEAVGEDIDANR